MNVVRIRRPGRRARRVLVGAVVLAVVGVGYATYSASADGSSYRTATATTGDGEQTLDLTGTVEPAGRADLAFATSGTIEDITVDAGDEVTAGQVLGTLDDTSLRKAVQQARAAVAAARAQLETDEEAQADTVSSASSSTGTSSTPSSASTTPTPAPSASASDSPDGSGGPGGTADPVLAELVTQQQAVTTAQSTVSASLTSARDALTAQQSACAAAFTADPTPDPSTDPTTDPSTDPTTDPTTDPGVPSDDTNQACTDALVAVQAAQAQVATDQDALQSTLETLATTLTTAITAVGEQTGDTGDTQTADTGDAQTGGTSKSPPATGSTGSTGSTAAASGSTTVGGSRSVTAASLAHDQASIDAGLVDLVVARQELRMATVTAPFAGEIVAVDASEGDSVSSGTEVFILVSRGTTTVQVDATSTQVDQLEAGQAVTAVPAGSDQKLAGTVTQISTVPDDSSTYPVTITLARKHLDIATGLSASVSVVTSTAKDVVTVPASAVTDGTVTVKDGDTVTPTRVTTGVVGATSVEIVAGLDAGDVVVLADLDQALPTIDDSTTQRGGFGGGTGGFGGAPPGGGQGGPPARTGR